MKVRVPAGLNFYPDVTFVCGEPKYLDASEDALLNPLVIVEVLSDSTEATDRGRKFKHYRTIASLRAYLLVAQDQVLAELYIRQPDNRWLLTSAGSLDETLDLEPISCQLALAEIYRKVFIQGAIGRE